MQLNRFSLVSVLCAAALSGAAWGQVFPNQPHVAYNFIPFGGGIGTSTYHQVFEASQFGPDPFEIHSLGFSTNESLNGQTATYDRIMLSLGYTNRTPGTLSPNLPDNPSGRMTNVYRASNFSELLQSNSPDDFNLVFQFAFPWRYDPSAGNLLVEIHIEQSSGPAVSCSHSSGVPLASRAWNTPTFGNGADGAGLRMRFDRRSICRSPGGPDVTLSGSIPGFVTLRWSGAEPNRPAILAFARNRGNFVIPSGPLMGTRLCLSNPALLTPPGVFHTGPNGEGQLSGNASSGPWCIQMVVVGSAGGETSDVLGPCP